MNFYKITKMFLTNKILIHIKSDAIFSNSITHLQIVININFQKFQKK